MNPPVKIEVSAEDIAASGRDAPKAAIGRKFPDIDWESFFYTPEVISWKKVGDPKHYTAFGAPFAFGPSSELRDFMWNFLTLEPFTFYLQ